MVRPRIPNYCLERTVASVLDRERFHERDETAETATAGR